MAETGPHRLFDLNREREDIIADVVERVLSERVRAAWEDSDQGLEYVLNEAAFHEMSRLEGSTKKRHHEQYAHWQQLAHTVGRNAEEDNAELLADLVRQYARDIVGKFEPWVFRLATSAIPVGVNALFAAQNPLGALRGLNRLTDKIRFEGELERLRRLAKIGTLVVVPTHSSNMDSILVGWGLEVVGLPPVTYGAGKNLFRAPLTAFFMHRLGAYKVDRRLRHSIYKEVLKSVSQVLLERGYHSLFFPGGTRSRSGAVESRLKLGLMGTAISAYVEGLKRGDSNRFFVVPVTINYHLVLEAETLISDYLRTDGQQRFIIEDDEFSDIGRVVRFIMNTMTMENPLSLYFCPPMDLFGNAVDDEGLSYDRQGRRIDPRRYVETDRGPEHDEERDREYTRLLGVQIQRSFRQHTLLFSIHLVSLVLVELVRSRHPSWDLYRAIRFGRGEFLARSDVVEAVGRLLQLAREDAGQGHVRLGHYSQHAEAAELVDEACRYFGMYHTTPLVTARGDSLEITQPSLLYFYSNRARGLGYVARLFRGGDP